MIKQSIKEVIRNQLRKHPQSNLYSEAAVNLITEDIMKSLEEQYVIDKKINYET